MSTTYELVTPRRAIRLVLEIEADDEWELVLALHALHVKAFRAGFSGNGAREVYGYGWRYDVDRIEQTHEQYVTELAAHLKQEGDSGRGRS